MNKVLLIPDSFKGTMSSSEICEIMGNAIKKYYPNCDIHSIPVADGGEGSVDSFITAVGGRKITVKVKGPWGNSIPSFYGIISGDTAIVEMAAAAGLPLVEDNKNAGKTTTYGVGELMLYAAESGVKKLIIGLGGSATNDGGVGAAAACGVKFYNKDNLEFIPVGDTLGDISHIDCSGLDPKLRNIEIITMCDIDNPLCGEHGASAVFGPQKGATEQDIKRLDAGLSHLADIVKRDIGKNIIDIPGAGAAGGMGAGMIAFFGSSLQMGIETVLDTVGFDSLLSGSDYVFTGEGKIDFQSLRGKVVIGVARRAKKQNVPVIAIVGDIGDNIEGVYDEGVSAVFSINRVAVPFKIAKNRSGSDMALTMDNLVRFMKLSK